MLVKPLYLEKSGQTNCSGEKYSMTLKRYQIVVITVGLILSVICLWPLAGYGIVTAGALFPFLFGICMMAYGGLREKIRTKKAGRVVDGIVLAVVLAGVLLFLMISGFMAWGIKEPVALDSQTVVVLGCKVNGNTPSLMLSRRLDAAYDLLKDHPGLNCVVSGGQGEDEIRTEASAMKEYLVNRGIAPERIYEESESLNTQQNLFNSKRVIEENALSRQVIVVTDFFHQFRGQFYARKSGLEATGVSCKTKLDLLPFYWVRESFAVTKALLGM